MKRVVNSGVGLLLAVGLAAMPGAAVAVVAKGVDYDSADSYDETDGMQPDGQWSYGKYTGLGNWGSFALLPETNAYYVGQTGGSGVHWTDPGGSYPKVGKFFIHPDASEWAVKRWTSDVTGWIEIDYDVMRLYTGATRFYISHNGNALPLEDDGAIDLNTGYEQHAGTLRACVVDGDVMDFCLDPVGANTADWAHLWVRVRAQHTRLNDLPTGLAVHWDMDAADDLPTFGGNRWTKVADSSGNNRHGLLTGSDGDERVTGLCGNALDFDGTNGAFTADVAGIEGATELTISLWIKPDRRDDGDGLVTSAAGGMTGLVLADHVNGIQPYGVIMGNPTGDTGHESASSTLPIPDGIWSHVVLVWSSNTYQRIYVNGELGADDPTPYSGAISGSVAWYVGQDRTESGRRFDGLMDDITIWTHALTETQIRAIYRLGTNGWDASYLNNDPTVPPVPGQPSLTGVGVHDVGRDHALADVRLAGTNALVTLYWGKDNQATNFAWTFTNSVLASTHQPIGQVANVVMSNLVAGTEYFYIFHASNSVSGLTAWSDPGRSFTSLSPWSFTNGLQVWLDSSDVDGQGNATLANGNDVTTWVNRADGNAGDAVTAGGSSKGGAFSVGTGPAGQSTIRLNGTNDSFMLSEFMASDTFSIFCMAKNTGGSGSRALFVDWGYAGGAARKAVRLQTSNGGLYMRDDNNHVFTPAPSVGSQLADRTWAILELHLTRNDAGGYTAELGESAALVSQTDTSFIATTWETGANDRYRPRIGCSQHYYEDVADSYFGGELCELLIYDHAVTGDDRATVETYLEDKYFNRQGGTLLIIR